MHISKAKIERTKRILTSRFRELFLKKAENKFLFILSPPYSGSTLLHQVLSTSSKISINNSKGTREGQVLPGVRKHMFENLKKWDENYKFDWPLIKKEWLKYWDRTYPILLEKSPPNLVRSKAIEREFSPAYFIILYRNPYAICESLMRRDNYSPKQAAEFIIKCFKHQINNIKNLENVVSFSYEALSNYPFVIQDEISSFLVELNDIKLNKNFNLHNEYSDVQKIMNSNEKKIANLTVSAKEVISKSFRKSEEVITYFGYKIEEK